MCRGGKTAFPVVKNEIESPELTVFRRAIFTPAGALDPELWRWRRELERTHTERQGHVDAD
jgi:hypothetical protein